MQRFATTGLVFALIGFFSLITAVLLVLSAKSEIAIFQSIAAGVIALGFFKTAEFFTDKEK